MNSSNTLCIIASFLDYKSLTVFSTINKLFQKISQTSELWKALMLIEYFGDYNFFGYFSFRDNYKGEYYRKSIQDMPNWKNLLKKRIISQKKWSRLKSIGFPQGYYKELSKELYFILCMPDIPLPSLTRESLSFLTIFQNLLAQIIYPPAFGFFSDPQAYLPDLSEECFNQAYQELLQTSSWEFLYSIRWVRFI